MALSYVTYPADGVTTQYDITFGYLARSHVFVFVDDQLRSFRWVTGNRVELNLAPDPGQEVKLQRLTDRVTRITDFSDGQTLLAGDLDAGDLQNFYIVQELLDEIYDGVLTGTVPVRDPGSDYVTTQWVQEQLEDNQLTSQAFAQLLQRITDEEVARAQALVDEASARASALAAEAIARALEIDDVEQVLADNHAFAVTENQARLSETTANAQSVTALTTRIGDAEAAITNVNTAVAAETGARTSQVNAANSRIDGVESSVTNLTQTVADNNQARIDDITQANAATAGAQADATNALGLVATEASARATEVSRIEVEFRARDEGSDLLKNSRFQADPVGTVGVPTGWADWVRGTTVLQAVDGTGGHGFVSRQTAQPNEALGVQQDASGITAGGQYTVTARVRRRGGTFESTGVLVYWYDSVGGQYLGDDSLVFKNTDSHEGPTGVAPDGTNTYSKVITAPAGAAAARIYAMAQYATFGSVAGGCTVDWYECSISPLNAGVQRALSAQASADQAQVLIASETAARASAISTVQAAVGENAASVTELVDALATGNSSQSRLLLGVNTTNNEASVELFAAEGDGVWNGSKIKFSAGSFEFDGNAVFNKGALNAAGTAVNFTVGTTAPSNPVDGQWWADTAGGTLYIRFGGIWQTVANISLDNTFRLEGEFLTVAEAPGSGGTGTTPAFSLSALNASGSVSYTWYFAGGDSSISISNPNISNPTFSATPGSGNVLQANWRCIATDGSGAKASFDLLVQISDVFTL
jgi:hypothetical protein